MPYIVPLPWQRRRCAESEQTPNQVALDAKAVDWVDDSPACSSEHELAQDLHNDEESALEHLSEGAIPAGSEVAWSPNMLDVEAPLGPIERFMVEEHVRIERLLELAAASDPIEDLAYTRFRHDLLRHIAMEEKVLLPYVRAKRAGESLPMVAAIRSDHSEIAKLLVRSPTPAIVDALRGILARHTPLEEGDKGLFAICDALAGDAAEAEAVVARMRAQPKVPLAKYYDGPLHRRP